MTIELPRETRERALASIKRFASEDLELDVGDLKAQLVYDFFLRELAPSVYNHAVADAQRHLLKHVEETDAHVHEDEFRYWRK